MFNHLHLVTEHFVYRGLCICTISKLPKLPDSLDSGLGGSILICRLSLLYCLLVAICSILYFALGYLCIVWLVTEACLVVVQAQLPTWSTFFGSSALSKPVVSQGMLLCSVYETSGDLLCSFMARMSFFTTRSNSCEIQGAWRAQWQCVPFSYLCLIVDRDSGIVVFHIENSQCLIKVPRLYLRLWQWS